MDKFKQFVEAINEISSQVYAFLALLVGLSCILAHQKDAGTEILIGAFAILRTGPTKADH